MTVEGWDGPRRTAKAAILPSRCFGKQPDLVTHPAAYGNYSFLIFAAVGHSNIKISSNLEPCRSNSMEEKVRREKKVADATSRSTSRSCCPSIPRQPSVSLPKSAQADVVPVLKMRNRDGQPSIILNKNPKSEGRSADAAVLKQGPREVAAAYRVETGAQQVRAGTTTRTCLVLAPLRPRH